MHQALNMPRFIICRDKVNIIIIVTNFIILDFLSARFVDRGALQNTSWNTRIVRTFEVLKWTPGRIFNCETTKMKFAKNIKNGFLSKNIFV